MTETGKFEVLFNAVIPAPLDSDRYGTAALHGPVEAKRRRQASLVSLLTPCFWLHWTVTVTVQLHYTNRWRRSHGD